MFMCAKKRGDEGNWIWYLHVFANGSPARTFFDYCYHFSAAIDRTWDEVMLMRFFLYSTLEFIIKLP